MTNYEDDDKDDDEKRESDLFISRQRWSWSLDFINDAKYRRCGFLFVLLATVQLYYSVGRVVLQTRVIVALGKEWPVHGFVSSLSI